MNELSTITKLEGMMKDLVSISIQSEKKIDAIGTKVNSVEKRMDDFENNSELTTQQRNSVRRAVNKQVYSLLQLPERKCDWSKADKITAEKYSRLFHQRCYSEVAKRGHLAQPYGTTIAQNFIQAINDIEAWVPSQGIDGLKLEADEAAEARRIAREQGYF